MSKRISLREARKFHGHLGPYLVLGMLMGDLAIKKLKCGKHFGIEAQVKGALRRPKSCLIDGIQLSTGCTYGKGNINKVRGDRIEVALRNLKNNNKIKICLINSLITKLDALKGHKDCERFARTLLKLNPEELFKVNFEF